MGASESEGVATSRSGRALSQVVREECWSLSYLLDVMGHPAAGFWDRTLRDFEDAFVEPECWTGALEQLRTLVNHRGMS